MILKRLPVVLFVLISFRSISQTPAPLPRSTPESEGVSSAGIRQFLAAAVASKNEFHSFMFLRHGKVIAEGWWDPFRPDFPHTLYSVSKSFTSSAIGFAVSEGRLKVTDKVVSFFPHDLPDSISPNLADLTVKDLLDMSEGQDPEPTHSVTYVDSNWVRSYLAVPIVHKPGTQFLYNSLGVYMLAAIVEKVTGQKLIDYLSSRLFKPLGIQGADWEVSPQGIATGGWGLRLKTEDLAKVGQLYLRKGQWNGRQILPANWVEEATSMSIMQTPDPASRTPRDSSDWLQGYGYLFWRCRPKNVYRADGAMGQYIIVMPDQDAVVAITSETASMQDEMNLVWRYLLPAIHDVPAGVEAGQPDAAGRRDALPADAAAQAVLKKQLAALALRPPATASGVLGKRFQAASSGKIFPIAPNDAHIRSMSFSWKGSVCKLWLMTDTGNYKLEFGLGKWEKGVTTLHGPHLTSAERSSLVGLPPFRTVGSYRWKDENILELTLRYIESPHTETITCHFAEGMLAVTIEKSFDFGKKKIELKQQAVDR